MNKKKRRFPWGIVVIVLIVIAVGAFFGVRYVQGQSTTTTLPANLTTTAIKTGSLAATIGASGNVRASQSATLSWSTSGRVGQINVKQGQKVQNNDILAMIDVTTLQSSNLISAPSDLAAAQKALADLQDTTTAKAQAQQALVTAQKAVDDAQNARDLLNYNRGQNGNLDAAYAQLYIAQDALNKAQSRFDAVANRAETDPARAQALTALVQAQQTLQAKQQIVNWYQSGPTSTDIAQADAALAVAQANLAAAQKNWDQVKNGPQASDIAAAQAKIDSIKATLNQRYILAPFSGTVTSVKSLQGDLVSSGTVAMRIDDLSTMYVDLQISEIDVDRVQLQQAVTITFDALPNKTYKGTVDHIDSVGTISSGAVNFTVTVKMTDPDASVKSGMTASARIVLQQVDNVMLVPNRGIRTQNNAKYVIVLQNGVLNSIAVRVGISNDTQTQVISTSLKDGDLVVTNPLSDLQKNGQNLFNALRVGGAGGFGGAGGGIPGGGVPGGGFQGRPGGGGD